MNHQLCLLAAAIAVFGRIAQGTEAYAPGNVPKNLEVVENAGSTTTSNAVQQLIWNELRKASSLLSNLRWAVILRISAHITMLALLVFIFVMYLLKHLPKIFDLTNEKVKMPDEKNEKAAG